MSTNDPCRSSDACATCGIRRDEHSDQARGTLPELQITAHSFVEGSYPEHYGDYGCAVATVG